MMDNRRESDIYDFAASTTQVSFSEDLIPVTATPGGRKYRCIELKKNACTRGVRRSQRTRYRQ